MELDYQGKIIMTPVKVNHSILQGKIIGAMYQFLSEGEALAECAIKTREGTKVADVAWASNKLLSKIENEVECSVAPDICVEVLSFSNTKSEIMGKRALYFEEGALEFWICDSFGNMSFFSENAELESSIIASGFPSVV